MLRHPHHARADPVAQFGGGGAGERDDQQASQRKPLRDIPGDEPLDGVGLAGARAGLQHGDAAREWAEEIEGHQQSSTFSCVSSGSHNSWARRQKRSSRRSSKPQTPPSTNWWYGSRSSLGISQPVNHSLRAAPSASRSKNVASAHAPDVLQYSGRGSRMPRSYRST